MWRPGSDEWLRFICEPILFLKEALNNSTCADWRGNLAPIKAQKRRNPLWISSFCNAEWHKIHRQDVRGELFSVSLIKLSRMEPDQQQEAAAWMIEGKVRSVDGYQEKKKWADVAARAETVVVQDPNLPFKIETKRFHSFEESIADMKTEKTCCDSPDMFMSDITHYIDQFCRGLDVYYHPQYASVYPSITKEQLDFLQGRANVIHEAVDAILDFIQHPENKTSKQENENE